VGGRSIRVSVSWQLVDSSPTLPGLDQGRRPGDGPAILIVDGIASFSVTAGSVGVCAAAILGFTDGLSLESDA
jgi:hypothetical protein